MFGLDVDLDLNKKKIRILHPFPQHSPFFPNLNTHKKRENPQRKPNLLRLEPIVYGPDISYVFVYRSRTYTVASANRDRLGFCAHKNWDTPIMAFYFLTIPKNMFSLVIKFCR